MSATMKALITMTTIANNGIWSSTCRLAPMRITSDPYVLRTVEPKIPKLNAARLTARIKTSPDHPEYSGEVNMDIKSVLNDHVATTAVPTMIHLDNGRARQKGR
ncbi:hypothetical protein GCM10027562_40920 [Arthrobacter pigmenti]